jgi:hypothetical protein
MEVVILLSRRRFAVVCSSAFLLSLVLLATLCTGQATFERTYGGSYRDEGLCVWLTSDGGYLISGSTESFGVGMTDVYLIKIDSLGDTAWTKAYGGADFECGQSVQQTLDSGCIIAGYTESFGAGLLDVYLVKTDASGDTQWTRTYGGPSYDCAYSVQQTQDSGYIVAGYTESFGAGLLDVYLVKTDASGDTQWTRTYGGSSYDCAYSVQQMQDGGYIIAGYTESFGEGGQDIYFVRTDASGDTLWARTYGGPNYDCGYSVRETPAGGYVGGGYTESFGAGLRDVYLVWTDSSGNTIWLDTYGGTDYDCAYSVLPTMDGGYLVAGYTESWGAGLSDVYSIKIDSLGGAVWTREYGGRLYDYGRCLEQTPDSGFAIAGITSSFGAGEEDVYLVKLDQNGRIARDVRVANLDAPPDTVFSDSIYSVTATVENLMPGYPSFEVTVNIDGYADAAQVIALPVDSMHRVDFASWHVPSADSASYTMTVCADVAGDIDTSNDSIQKSIFAYNPVGLTESPADRARAWAFNFHQRGKNPFRGSTTLNYSLGASTRVVLTVFDSSGRRVRALVDEGKAGGSHSVVWDGRGESFRELADGVYFVVLEVGGQRSARKLILLR